MSDRTFTLDEAHMLLPILESLLKQAIHGKKLIEDVDAELQETPTVFSSTAACCSTSSISPSAKPTARRHSPHQRRPRRNRRHRSPGERHRHRIARLPCKVEGEILLLCWKLASPTSPTGTAPVKALPTQAIDHRIANAGKKRPK